MNVTRARLGRGAASLLLTCLLALALSVSAHAAEGELTADDLGLRVQVGFDGQAVRRAWLPVAVSMAPGRPFEGELRVIAHHMGGRQVVTESVEVPAGSAKQFRFVIPPSDGVEVQAVPSQGKGVAIRANALEGGNYLVGLLGTELPADAPPLRSYALDEKGAYVAVDPAWLDHTAALTSLSAVVAPLRTLEGLSERQRRHLVAEVAAGIDLVIVTDTPGEIDLSALSLRSPVLAVGPDPELPDTLAVEPAGHAWALEADEVVDGAADVPVAATAAVGRGRVTVSGSSLGRGDIGSNGAFWGMLLQPTSRSGGTIANDELGGVLSNVAEGLRSSPLELPPLGWFVAFLLAYVVVVGPLNGIVLWRAGRRELAWVTIPAVTIVFAAGAWITSADQSSSLSIAGRATYWVDGHGSEVLAAVIRAPRADEHHVTLEGSDWAVLAGTWSATTDVRREGDQLALRMQLEALQSGSVLAQRPAASAAPLEVSASVVGDRIEVEVTNRSTALLDDVMLRAGTARDEFGPLAPGETLTHSFETRGTLPVEQAWHDPFAGGRELDGRVEAPQSLESVLRWNVLDGNPGVVWITGTYAPGYEDVPVLTGRARAGDQGTFVAVGVTPAQTDDHLSPFEVGRQLLTTGFGSGSQPGPLAIEGAAEAVLRYRIPANGTVAELTSSLGRGQLRTGHGELHACTGDETPDGQVREICAPEALLPLVEQECPQGATQCSLDGESLTICPENGPCATEPVPPQLADAIADQRASSGGLEVYDRLQRAWLPIDEVFGDGAVTDPTPYVSPLGEVFVRVSGELLPFDFSGRGIGGRFAS